MHNPRVHTIIIVRENRGKWLMARNLDKTWLNRHTSWLLFWSEPMDAWIAAYNEITKWGSENFMILIIVVANENAIQGSGHQLACSGFASVLATDVPIKIETIFIIIIIFSKYYLLNRHFIILYKNIHSLRLDI